MLSGGYPVFFGLRFFSVVFLFDNHVCCVLFLLGRLAFARGSCCGCVIVITSAFVIKCIGLDHLANIGSFPFWRSGCIFPIHHCVVRRMRGIQATGPLASCWETQTQRLVRWTDQTSNIAAAVALTYLRLHQ